MLCSVEEESTRPTLTYFRVSSGVSIYHSAVWLFDLKITRIPYHKYDIPKGCTPEMNLPRKDMFYEEAVILA